MTSEERLRLWNVPFSRNEVLDGLPLADYAAIIKRFHVLYAKHHGKTRWGHFDISTLTEPERLLDWFPDAQFVHLVRDARGVALSNRGVPFSLGNILECAEQWTRDVGGNLQWGRALPPDRYQIVHYEVLVKEPEATLTVLCNFIGLDYSPAMLGYTDAVGDRVPTDRRDALWPLLTGPPEARQAERWQQEMTPSEITLVEEIAEDLLVSLGYGVQQMPKACIGATVLKSWLHLGRGNRWGRLKGRWGVG